MKARLALLAALALPGAAQAEFPDHPLRLIVREGMTMGLAGVGAGLVCAVGVSQVLGSLVFGVPVRDPATFAGVSLVLALVALAACAVPAMRASRVDPMTALRAE